MGSKPPNRTVGRIDHAKGYEPGNCEWQTWEEQGRSKCTAVIRSDGVRFESINAAAASVGRSPSGIGSVLNGKQTQSGGYGWTRA
jgi:hypothetical protein